MNPDDKHIVHPFANDAGEVDSNIRALLDAAPDAMIIVDQRGRMVLVNAQAEKMFGYGRAELLGERVEKLIPERYRGAHVEHRAHYGEQPVVRPMGIGLELFGRRKDGTEFPVEISLSPLRTKEGLFVTSAIRDVSERRQAEERINRLNADLGEALKRSEKLAATGRMMATIAHEINNPLESLTNILYLLQTASRLSDEDRELLRLAQQELGVLMNISRQTLAPHRETKLPVVTKVSQLLDDVCMIFTPKLQSGRIRLVRDYTTDGQVTIYPSELRQVFTNLISNAIDAMSNGGELRLGIGASNGGVTVSVADTGHGIPAENLAKIYEPFFTTKGDRGTGVGLWVIRGILQKLGGRIEVTSSTEPGRSGTCFTVFLPAAGETASSVAQKYA